jgi:hypothetical protein
MRVDLIEIHNAPGDTEICIEAATLNCQKRSLLESPCLGVALVSDDLSLGDVFQNPYLIGYQFITSTDMIVAAQF